MVLTLMRNLVTNAAAIKAHIVRDKDTAIYQFNNTGRTNPNGLGGIAQEGS